MLIYIYYIFLLSKWVDLGCCKYVKVVRKYNNKRKLLRRYLNRSSISLLLKRALDTLERNKTHSVNKWIKSTPGIFTRKFNDDELFILYLDSFNLKPVVIIVNNKIECL